jgi:hypothetical protein
MASPLIMVEPHGLVYWKATMGNQQKMRVQQVIHQEFSPAKTGKQICA